MLDQPIGKLWFPSCTKQEPNEADASEAKRKALNERIAQESCMRATANFRNIDRILRKRNRTELRQENSRVDSTASNHRQCDSLSLSQGQKERNSMITLFNHGS